MKKNDLYFKHPRHKVYKEAWAEKNYAYDEFTRARILRVFNPKIKKVETVKEALLRGVKIEKIDTVEYFRPLNKVGDKIGSNSHRLSIPERVADNIKKLSTSSWFGK